MWDIGMKRRGLMMVDEYEPDKWTVEASDIQITAICSMDTAS